MRPRAPGSSSSRALVPAPRAAFATQNPAARAMRTRGRVHPDLVAGFAGDDAGAPDLVTVVRPRAAGAVRDVLRAAKTTIDPATIMNPGVLV